MNETTFENAKVGDRVWDFDDGWGTLSRSMLTSHPSYPLEVRFSTNKIGIYTISGISFGGEKQTLFWDEVKFEAPPRPKRKVKKVVVGWVNIYSSQCGSIYDTPSEARRNRDAACLGEPLLIKHEYEIEE